MFNTGRPCYSDFIRCLRRSGVRVNKVQVFIRMMFLLEIEQGLNTQQQTLSYIVDTEVPRKKQISRR